MHVLPKEQICRKMTSDCSYRMQPKKPTLLYEDGREVVSNADDRQTTESTIYRIKLQLAQFEVLYIEIREAICFALVYVILSCHKQQLNLN